ncbi:MAG: hypothetical protein MJ137_02495 [Clostridia bacterium]|nr:hypothetical protein [Clostridia bacterium]
MKRNEIVRTLLAALSILILVLPFASCSDASLPADSSEGTESAPVETDIGGIDFKNPEEPVVVFSGKKTYYTVVRPDSYPDELVDVFQNIMRKYRNENGINIECATDWHKPDADVSAMTEILVGNCDREETRRVMSMLGLGDYAVVKVDNKIVVAAHTPEKLSEAVACLCEKMQVVEKDGEKTVILTEN